MTGSKLLALACVLPLTFAFLSQGSSCKENQSKKQSDNSSGPSANQMKSPAISQKSATIPEGVWGGVHIRIEVTDQGADIEYDCAHGRILEPLRVNAEGRFEAKGTHARERPGPVREGTTPEEQPARFAGVVNGKTMTLKVTVTATSENIGTFTLTQGSEGVIRKCG